MTLDKDDVRLARACLADRSEWRHGAAIGAYEQAFSRWNGSKSAFSFISGRVALSACLRAVGVQPGDEVILPGYTCVAVANALTFDGIKPAYADIELQTYGLEAASFARLASQRTKAVILQHLYGLVSRDYQQVVALARERGIKVIEDCAHSTGAEFLGRKVGNLGDAAFYSSERSKIFNTIQGGIATTNDALIAGRLARFQEQAPFPEDRQIDRLLKNVLLDYCRHKHPSRWLVGPAASLFYHRNKFRSTTDDEILGLQPRDYARRMPAALARLGLNQLEKIDAYNESRRAGAAAWARWCDANRLERPLVARDSLPVFLRYPVMMPPERKKDMSWARHEFGWEPGRWFISNLHPAPTVIAGCPNADRAVGGVVNFPTLRAS